MWTIRTSTRSVSFYWGSFFFQKLLYHETNSMVPCFKNPSWYICRMCKLSWETKKSRPCNSAEKILDNRTTYKENWRVLYIIYQRHLLNTRGSQHLPSQDLSLVDFKISYNPIQYTNFIIHSTLGPYSSYLSNLKESRKDSQYPAIFTKSGMDECSFHQNEPDFKYFPHSFIQQSRVKHFLALCRAGIREYSSEVV